MKVYWFDEENAEEFFRECAEEAIDEIDYTVAGLDSEVIARYSEQIWNWR